MSGLFPSRRSFSNTFNSAPHWQCKNLLESVGIMGLLKLLELVEHHESVNEITIYSNLHVTNIATMLIPFSVFQVFFPPSAVN